jgi:hypothetical protein
MKSGGTNVNGSRCPPSPLHKPSSKEFRFLRIEHLAPHIIPATRAKGRTPQRRSASANRNQPDRRSCARSGRIGEAHLWLGNSLLLGHQSSHRRAAQLTAGLGVERSHRSPMTMAGEDLLFLSQGYLGAVGRRRASRGSRGSDPPWCRHRRRRQRSAETSYPRSGCRADRGVKMPPVRRWMLGCLHRA